MQWLSRGVIYIFLMREYQLGPCRAHPPLIDKSKLQKPWNFYLAPLDAAIAVVGMYVRNMEVIQYLLEAGRKD